MNKRKLHGRWLGFFICLFLLALILPTGAQSTTVFNSTNQPVAQPPKTNILQVLSAPAWLASLASSLADDAPYISNKVATLEMGALYNASDKSGKFGGFADVTVPTSQQTGVGLGVGYLNGHLLDANVTLQVGTTTQVPLIGTCYAYLSSGPAYDFQSKSIAAYNFAGLIKKFDISTHWKATAGYGLGNISTISGVEQAFGTSLTYAW